MSTPQFANDMAYRVSYVRDGKVCRRDIPVSEIWKALHGAVALLYRSGLDQFDMKELTDVLEVAWGKDEVDKMMRKAGLRE